MITQNDLEEGVKGQIRHLQKNSQGMIYYKLFSHFQARGPIVREI